MINVSVPNLNINSPIIFEMPDAYRYLDNIARYVMTENKNEVFDEYNLSGARLSAKTTSITIELAKVVAVALQENKKVGVYATRKLTKSVPELVEEIKVAMDEYGISYKFTGSSTGSNFPMFKFANGSFIQVVGITKNKNTVNLKGLAKCYKFTLCIDWFEEANECDLKDFQDLRFAVRGANKEIHITSCNPDLIYQAHIKYLNENAPFNLNILKAYGQQMTIWSKKLTGNKKLKVINHYTMWKVNPFLNDEKIAALEELLVSDPIKAIPWYWGFPGSLNGTVFGEYLPRIRKIIDFRITEYLFGLDLGYSEAPTAHPTVLSCVGANSDKTRYHVLGEYFHDNLNGRHKDLTTIYLEIVRQMKDWIIRFNIKDRVIINTDYGSGGLVAIDMMNKIRQQLMADTESENDYRALERMVFSPVDKEVWLIKDRVDAFHILMSTEKLGMSEELTPNILRQLALMIYKEQRDSQSYKVDIVDLNDDGFDSLCYALMPHLKRTLQNINPLIRKGAW